MSNPLPAEPLDPHFAKRAQYSGSFPSSLKAMDDLGLFPINNCDSASRKKSASRFSGSGSVGVHSDPVFKSPGRLDPVEAFDPVEVCGFFVSHGKIPSRGEDGL